MINQINYHLEKKNFELNIGTMLTILQNMQKQLYKLLKQKINKFDISDDIKDITKDLDILTNLEQIKHLNFLGEYGQSNQKIGLWKAIWKGTTLKDVGGYLYSIEGKKIGQWKEIITNYQSNAQVYEVGEYFNGQRKGRWKYMYGEKEIGGGEYSLQNLKNGKWIELSDGFWDRSKITYNGEYKNGKKFGFWDTCLIENGIFFGFNYKKIGGGKYGCSKQKDSDFKVGKWIELSEGLQSDSQVTYIGNYENGKKVGRWDTFHRGKQIGGGSYIVEEEGNSNKVGKWTELSEGFYDYSQVTFIGQYQRGIKVGQWNIQYIFGKQIGGGFYDVVEKGTSIKIGKWIEPSDEFGFYSWVTYYGQYKNGKKVARWEILYAGNQIGGGCYDDKAEGDSLKIGKWIVLSDWFFIDSQVIYEGQYVNGKKIGLWEILYRKEQRANFQKIGGGLYDYQENGSSIKIGKWIELSDGFNCGQQLGYTGEYRNGQKVDNWVPINFRRIEKLQEVKYEI